MDIYEELGVKKLVNSAGTYTIIGGSRMSENSLQAMNQAAHYHVELRAMQAAVRSARTHTGRSFRFTKAKGSASSLLRQRR